MSIVFDLDDTLINTSNIYNIATLEGALLIAKALGHDAPKASSILNVIAVEDSKKHEGYCYSLDRFPTSVTKAYINLCKESNTIPRHDLMLSLHNRMYSYVLGDVVPYTKREGVDTILSRLKTNHKLTLVTLGVSQLQWHKIRLLGLTPYFDSIYVNSEASTKFDILKEIKEKDNSFTCVVGDSYYADIDPAVKLELPYIRITPPGPGGWIDRNLDNVWKEDAQHNADTLEQVEKLIEALYVENRQLSLNLS